MGKKNKKPRKGSTQRGVEDTEDKPQTMPLVGVAAPEEEGRWDENGLTVRQKLFVEYLLGPAGGKGTDAYLMAGYTENRRAAAVGAVKLYNRPNVQEAISRAIAKRRDNPEWVRDSLLEIAAASMTNFLTVDEDGKARLDFEKARDAAAIGHIREYHEESFDRPDGKGVVTKRRIKLHDRTAALTTLAKMMGKLTETHIVTGLNGEPIKSEVTHKFDHDAYRELFRSRFAAGRNGDGVASANGN